MRYEEKYEERLTNMLLEHELIFGLLQQLKCIEPQAYLSAGVIRNWVWSVLHDMEYCFDQTEIDVIFHDSDDQQNLKTKHIARQLEQYAPNYIWDVTNQALVHTWYQTGDGQSIQPLQSIDEAISFWPETATAVAIRLLDHHQIEIIAPLGLTDLFELKLRWNDRLVSRGVFINRVQSKQFLTRWPRLSWIN